LPPATRADALRMLEDTLAGGAAGAMSPAAQAILPMISTWGEGGASRLLGETSIVPKPSAAFFDAFAIYCFEWDGVHKGAVVHTMSVVTGALLAALQHPPAPQKLDYPNSHIRFAGFIQVSKFLGGNLKEVPGLSDHLIKLLKYGPARSADDWKQDQKILARTREQVRAIVSEYGFLMLPTVPNPAFPHSANEPAAQADFSCLANIADLPSLTLPAGCTDDRLPIGVQIIASEGHEVGLFAFARMIDAKLSAYCAPPSVGE
jgi:hypothetical protein